MALCCVVSRIAMLLHIPTVLPCLITDQQELHAVIGEQGDGALPASARGILMRDPQTSTTHRPPTDPNLLCKQHNLIWYHPLPKVDRFHSVICIPYCPSLSAITPHTCLYRVCILHCTAINIALGPVAFCTVTGIASPYQQRTLQDIAWRYARRYVMLHHKACMMPLPFLA